MGNFLESPNREKTSKSGKATDISFNCCWMQGWRIEMEDAHTNILSLPAPFERWSFFAVYDGHAGSVVAKFSSQKLIDYILKTTYLKDLEEASDLIKNSNYDIEKLKEAICEAFLSLDEKMMNDNLTSGTTVTGVLLTPKHLFFINCGDSRSLLVRKDTNPKLTKENKLEKPVHPIYKEAILANKFAIERLAADNPPKVMDPENLLNDDEEKGEQVGSEKVGSNVTNEDEYGDCEDDNPGNYHVYFSTIDHKPMDAEEKKRIEDAGGMVIIQRINGALAVSRALGDFDYKRNTGRKPEQQQVSAVPAITCIERTSKDDQFQDAFIVVACDGIYDAITNDNLAKYLSYKLLSGENVDEITKDSLEFCLHLGSKDNMSLNFIGLSHQPKSVEWMVNKKRDLDNKLKIAAREIYDATKNKDSNRSPSNLADTIFTQLQNTQKLQEIYQTYIYKHQPPEKYPNTTVDKKSLILKFVNEFEEQS